MTEASGCYTPGMSIGAAARSRMTLAEFFDWDPGGDQRYELIEGVPYAMTYPKRSHGIIAANLVRRIAEALDARPPCHVVSEAGILSPTRNDTYYQADLAVTCQPHQADRPDTPQPLLVVEVLSPSTENHDRKLKLADYRKIPSVREILFVDQERPYCELHRRLGDDRWLVDLILELEARIELESLGVELPVAWIYANVTFAEPDQSAQS